MAVSFSSLISAMSKDTVLSALLALMKAAGFPTRSWSSVSVPRALLEVFSQALADHSATIANVARSGFLSLASEGWLTLLASEFFDVTRSAAVTTIGTFKLKDNGGGPHPIADGAVWFETSSGKKFVAVVVAGPATLALNGELDVTVQGESPGVAWNVLSGETIRLITSLPTVTVTNPTIGTTGTWITTQGVNEESDPALRTRCREKWSIVGAGVTDAYSFHAKAASDQVTKVRVYEATPTGGKVTLYVAGPDGAVASDVPVTVYDYLKDGRVPLCVTPIVYSVVNRTVPFEGNVTLTASKAATAKVAIAAAAQTYQDELDSGGTVRVAEMIQRVMEVDGVINFEPLRPDGSGVSAVPVVDDLVLGSNEFAKFTVSGLTYTEV